MTSTSLMKISKDEHERARLRSRRMAETDRISDLLTAEARGEAKGEAKGRVKGQAEGREEILVLLKKGISPDEIQKMFDII